MGNFDYVLERLKNQTHEETIATLIRAGILDPDKKLADDYCTKKQLKEKKKRREKKMLVVEGYTSSGTTCYLSNGVWIKAKYAGFSKGEGYHSHPIDKFESIEEAKQALVTADEISSYEIRELTQDLINQLS